MELVFVKIAVRQIVEKSLKISLFGKFFRIVSKFGRAYADNGIRVNGRDRPDLQLSVFFILHGKQGFLNRLCHDTLPFSVEPQPLSICF